MEVGPSAGPHRGCGVPSSAVLTERLKGVSMLILTRRVGETVMIGEEVSVTILGVKGNQVRVGINAPKNVAVHREEIFERIKSEGPDESPSREGGMRA